MIKVRSCLVTQQHNDATWRNDAVCFMMVQPCLIGGNDLGQVNQSVGAQQGMAQAQMPGAAATERRRKKSPGNDATPNQPLKKQLHKNLQ